MIIQCTKYQVPQTYLLHLSTGVVLSEEFQNAAGIVVVLLLALLVVRG